MNPKYEFKLNESSILHGNDIALIDIEGDPASYFTPYAANATFTNETTEVFAGSTSLKLTGSAATDQHYSYVLRSVTAGKTYMITFWSKSHASTDNATGYGIYDHTNSAWIIDRATKYTDKPSWEKVVNYFEAPSGCTQVRLYVATESVANATGYFDGLTLKEVNAYALESKSGSKATATDVFPVLDHAGSGTRWYEFDGVDDYMSLSSPISNYPYTICANAKTGSDVTNERTIVSIVDLSEFDEYFNIAVKSGTFYVNRRTTAAASYYNTGIQASSNTDYKVSVVFSSSTDFTIYVDEEDPVSVTTTSIPMSGIDKVVIGVARLSSASWYWSGNISMIRLFNTALTSDEVAYYSEPSNPIEYADTNPDTSTELVGSWTNSDFDSFTSSGTDITQMVSGAAGDNCYDAITAMTIGKRYILSFTSSQAIGCQFRLAESTSLTSSGYQVALNGIDAGINSISFIATKAFNYAGFFASDAFTDTQISNFSLTEAGCVLNLNAEGVYNNIWLDQTNGISATVSGATAVIPPESNLGATWFNGSKSVITQTGMDGLTGDITITGWIHPISYGEADPNGGYIFASSQIAVQYLGTGLQTIQFTRNNFADYARATTYVLSNNNTYHIAITSTSTGVTRIYINGIDRSNDTSAGTPISSTSHYIGNNSATTRTFHGWIKDLKIHKRILSLSEIQEDYARYKN